MELEEPCGCIRVPLGEEAGATAEEAQLTVQACPIQAFFVQVRRLVITGHCSPHVPLSLTRCCSLYPTPMP